MSDVFKLPGASLEEVEKIIEAFSHKGVPASNEEISQLVGSTSVTVSRCNGFLLAVGLLNGGKKKEATELGKKLGLALHHGQVEEIRKFWGEVVVGNEFLSEQVTAVRVQKAVKVEDLAPKIHYNSQSSKNKPMETGARTVTEILVKAGLITEENGMYTVPKGATEEKQALNTPKKEKGTEVPSEPETVEKVQVVSLDSGTDGSSPPVQLAINLQIQIQEFDDTSKYEDLFRALRKHLLQQPVKSK